MEKHGCAIPILFSFEPGFEFLILKLQQVKVNVSSECNTAILKNGIAITPGEIEKLQKTMIAYAKRLS